jgi:hypothetical protein
MGIAKLTEDEIRIFCANVTDEQREYCREHGGDPTWPENFLRTCAKDAVEGLILTPLSVESWWRSIGGSLGGPAAMRCVEDAEITTLPPASAADLVSAPTLQ